MVNLEPLIRTQTTRRPSDVEKAISQSNIGALAVDVRKVRLRGEFTKGLAGFMAMLMDPSLGNFLSKAVHCKAAELLCFFPPVRLRR